MFDELLCDSLRFRYRKLHCKKAVRVAAERLPVKEVAPAPYNLSYDKSLNSRVRHEPELKLLYLREYKKCESGRYHSSVYGKSSRPEIEYLKRMRAVIVPLKNDIVYSGPYYGCNQCIQRKINVIVDLLSRLFRLTVGDKCTGKHTKRYYHSIICNLNSEHRK